MKRFTSVFVVLLVVFLALMPTQASADGPITWQYRLHVYTQTVKEIGGLVYEPGKPHPLHFSTVAQSLRRQGYYRQSWSGNGYVIYHHFVRVVPMAPIILMAPGLYLQQNNPLHYPARTG